MPQNEKKKLDRFVINDHYNEKKSEFKNFNLILKTIYSFQNLKKKQILTNLKK